MIKIPAKAKERIIQGLKRFKPIVTNARDKDINESDTVTIIADILSDIFGYDKYTEITSEFAVKKTFCDLAITLGGTVKYLIEVKSAGTILKDNHIKQATDYGANSGIEWVILTNSVNWKVYRIGFGKPITNELFYEFDLTELNPKKDSEIELLYYLSREGVLKESVYEYYDYKKVLNKYVLSQLILTDPVVNTIRTNLRKIAKDCNATNEEIKSIIQDEIIKRECLDEEETKAAKKRVMVLDKKPVPKHETASPAKDGQN